ncbi:uncharacterized protein PAE49_003659 [Odontesthes bonariensis]
MSEELYAEPGTVKKVHFDQDHQESVVDIYVSAESLRVYDSPWVEDVSPGPVRAQHTVTFVNRISGKRRYGRYDPLILRVMCPLLLIAIVCLAVKMNEDKTNWGLEKEQLLSNNTELMKMADQLTANNTELIRERDDLQTELNGK